MTASSCLSQYSPRDSGLCGGSGVEQQDQHERGTQTAIASRPLQGNTGCSMQPARIKRQAELLKYITSLRTHEELLLYIDTCHQQLDTINLVTVLYRLARIYDNTQRPDQRSALKATLQDSAAFKLLLSIIHDHFLHLHAIFSSQLPESANNPAFGLGMRKAATTGVLPTAECIHSPRKAQCLSNLMWSLDKLEIMEGPKPEGGVTGVETTSSLACDLAMAAGPLVILTLPEFTSQGLGNLLWNFAKMPNPPAAVLTAIMEHSVQLLQGLTLQDVPDIQALSHSLRSIAHVRTRTTEVDAQPAWQSAVTTFLLHAAHLCIQALSKDHRDRANSNTGGPASSGAASSMPPGRQVASGQTIASIVWSYSAVLGSACGTQAPVSTLFLMIREHALARLEADLTRSGSPHLLLGSFTEPTLSRLVEAYEVAQLLSTELLQAVLDVASMRLHRPSVATQDTLGYKPEELCVLLSACHVSGVHPWSFLQSLSQRLSEYRDTTASWSPAQLLVLQRALKLQLTHVMHASGPAPTSNPNPPHAAMHGLTAAPSNPHANPRLSVRHAPQPRGPQYYYPGMLESPASAPLPVPSRLSSMTSQSLNSCISLPASGPERNAFNSALNSILFDSPVLAAQAAQAAQAGQTNGPWGGRHSGPLPRLQPNLLLQQPVPAAARAAPHPYSTAMAGGFDQPFQGYDLGGLSSTATIPGRAAGSNTHNLMMAAHPHMYLDTANSGGTSFLQPAWVVDESGHLQPWLPADPSPNLNNLQSWLPATPDVSPNSNNLQPWLLGTTTSADEAALALQHLLLAPPRGMGRQM